MRRLMLLVISLLLLQATVWAETGFDATVVDAMRARGEFSAVLEALQAAPEE